MANKIVLRLENLGYKSKLIDPLEFSLVDTISNYAGIIGAPSGSLIIARELSNQIFVTCLPNCSSGGPDDWIGVWGQRKE